MVGQDWEDKTLGSSATSSGSAPQHPTSTLTIQQGPQPGQRFSLDKETFTIGRTAGNDVAIANTRVSRHHANITWEGNQWVLHDLGTTNGTFVNGQRITGRHLLRNGDIIGLGDEVTIAFAGVGAVAADQTVSSPDGGLMTQAGPRSVQVTVPAVAPVAPVRYAARSNLNVWLLAAGGAAVVFLLLVLFGLVLLMLTREPAKPELVVQSPANGLRATAGQPVPIWATLRLRGGFNRLELWVDNAMVKSTSNLLPSGPDQYTYQDTWTPDTPGTHTLVLRAYNGSGQASDVHPLVVNVTGKQGDAPPAGTPAATAASAPIPTATTAPAAPVVMPTDTPTSTSTPTGTTVPCADNAAYVADVTVPDGTVFNAGASISKAWRLRNSGTCSWGGGYRLQFISGEKMSAPDSQAVVLTDPGNITDITVEMIAPSAPGDHVGSWRMVNNKGQAFGQTVTVHIKVPFPPTATGIATATSTATTVPPPPGPGPTPVIEFWADSTTIPAGSETTLHVNVQNVAAAWLDGEAVVGGHKDKTVKPCVQTDYTLDVQLPGGAHVYRVVTVKTTGSCFIVVTMLNPGWQLFQTPTNTPWFMLVVTPGWKKVVPIGP